MLVPGIIGTGKVIVVVPGFEVPGETGETTVIFDGTATTGIIPPPGGTTGTLIFPPPDGTTGVVILVFTKG